MLLFLIFINENLDFLLFMKPQEKVPEIKVKILQGQEWTLSRQKPENFTLIMFYRGHHCRVCRHYIHDLSVQLSGFEKRGVNVIAISSNSKEKATQSQNEWHTQDLLIGYDYPVEEARKLGLFISKAVMENEPDFFFEPALLVVRPNGTLYSIALQSIPFARPHFKDILAAFDFILRENYPPRGEA
jgi:peroxiredoxin